MALSWKDLRPCQHLNVFKLALGRVSLSYWSNSFLFDSHAERWLTFFFRIPFLDRYNWWWKGSDSFKYLFVLHRHRKELVDWVPCFIFRGFFVFLKKTRVIWSYIFVIAIMVTGNYDLRATDAGVFRNYKYLGECSFDLIYNGHALVLSKLEVTGLRVIWVIWYHIFFLSRRALELFLVSILNFQKSITHRIFLPVLPFHIIL